jgi:hypothetical protein
VRVYVSGWVWGVRVITSVLFLGSVAGAFFHTGFVLLALVSAIEAFVFWRVSVQVSAEQVRVVYPLRELTVARADVVAVEPPTRASWRRVTIAGRLWGVGTPILVLRDGRGLVMPGLMVWLGWSPRTSAFARDLGIPLPERVA